MMKLQGRMTHTEINSIIFSNRQVTECEKFYMPEGLLYSERDHFFLPIRKILSVAYSYHA